MTILLTLFPVLIIALAFFTLRFNGRKELLRMDLVQFLHAFVFTPAVIIWVKTVVFSNLKVYVGESLSVEDLFLVDNILTLISLYIFSFVVIHSLTKSFQLKREKDILFDLFSHSEYFHFWLSHLITYSGGLVLMMLLGVLNLFVPLTELLTKKWLYIAVFVGILLGILFYVAMYLYRVKEQRKFDRVMKFQLYIHSLIILSLYFIVRPEYSEKYAVFWCSSFFFISSAVLMQILRRGRKDQMPFYNNPL